MSRGLAEGSAPRKFFEGACTRRDWRTQICRGDEGQFRGQSQLRASDRSAVHKSCAARLQLVVFRVHVVPHSHALCGSVEQSTLPSATRKPQVHFTSRRPQATCQSNSAKNSSSIREQTLDTQPVRATLSITSKDVTASSQLPVTKKHHSDHHLKCLRRKSSPCTNASSIGHATLVSDFDNNSCTVPAHHPRRTQNEHQQADPQAHSSKPTGSKHQTCRPGSLDYHAATRD